jgi:hypothetical protein
MRALLNRKINILILLFLIINLTGCEFKTQVGTSAGFTMDGISVKVIPDCGSSSMSAKGKDDVTVICGDLNIRVFNGNLFINGEDYGAINKEDEVIIEEYRVSINGVNRQPI